MVSDDQLASLRAKYGRAKAITFNGVDLVFCKPTRAQARAYMAKREEDKYDADTQFAQALVVVCGSSFDAGVATKEAFLAFLDEYPLAPQSGAFGKPLGQLAGLVEDDETKKSVSGSQSNGTTPTTTPAG